MTDTEAATGLPRPTLADLAWFANEKVRLGREAARLTGEAQTLRNTKNHLAAHERQRQADAAWSAWQALDEDRQMQVFDWTEFISQGLELPEGRRRLYGEVGG